MFNVDKPGYDVCKVRLTVLECIVTLGLSERHPHRNLGKGCI